MDDETVSVDWQGYELYHLGFTGPMDQLSRREARAAFDRMMDARHDRIEILQALLARNGVKLTMDHDGVQELNDWFAANVERDPERPGYLYAKWYSVIFDTGMFLGEMLVERHPNLRWEFFTRGAKHISYQRPVIAGFTLVQYSKYTIDFWHRVRVYGMSVTAGQEPEPKLGTFTVRGVELDLDEISTETPDRKPPADAFWNWISTADGQA